MKDDLDRLMAEQDITALLINGATTHNPAMRYFSGAASLSDAILLKKQGRPPQLYCHAMERDEAARTGLTTRLLTGELSLLSFIETAGGDLLPGMALFYKYLLESEEVVGRVALYGQVDLGLYSGIVKQLLAMETDFELIGEVPSRAVLTQARATKDADEVARLRAIGETTTAVVGRTADFLTGQRVKNGVLVDRQGEPVTIGRVKRQINLWLAELGADNPEGVIFAMGRDAGVPHSVGRDAAPLEIGQPIVFDIFPCEGGGGYFYDFTRTWCLGHADDETERVYQDVLEVYQEILAALQPNTPAREYSQLMLERFEEKGHPTLLSDRESQIGCVHLLGHGVGLDVHESPNMSILANNHDLLLPGAVFTIEPGLYYPDLALGVRLEDTLWLRPDGRPEVLAEFPHDLILPIR